MKLNFDQRPEDLTEIMDDFDLKGQELKKTLDDLDRVNRLLGGNNITLDGIKNLLKEKSKDSEILIADIGCGNAAILRKIADYGRKNNYKFKLVGIDANPHAIEIAEKMSTEYPEISLETNNIFSEDFKKLRFDIILCTLTLHHFKNEEIKAIISGFFRQCTIGVVINDLHRSKMAYHLFKAFCAVFVNNDIARTDGLISIRRGFVKEDLENYALENHLDSKNISWKWAFRYQWIIKKVREKQ